MKRIFQFIDDIIYGDDVSLLRKQKSKNNAKIRDAKDNSKFYKAVKKEYGLVPIKGETFPEFEKRVHETLFNKSDPTQSPTYKSLNRKIKIKQEITEEVQRVTEKYLGIKNEPINAYLFEKSEEFNGASYAEKDGSAVVLIEEGKENNDEIKNMLFDGIIKIAKGEEIELEKSKKKFSLISILSEKPQNAVETLHKNLTKRIIQNKEYIMLHEGIHANHQNNHSTGRRRKGKPMNLYWTTLKYKFPVLNNLILVPRNNFTIETESYSFKSGMDMFYNHLIDDVSAKVKRETGIEFSGELANMLKEEFYQLNTKAAKNIITLGYLLPKKIYTPRAHYTLMVADGIIGSSLMGSDSWVWQGLGTLYLAKSASHALRIPLSAHYRNKLKGLVEDLDTLRKAHGSSGKMFYETLGKNAREIKNLAKKHKK